MNAIKHDMPFEAYSDSAGINASFLAQFSVTPAHGWHYLNTPRTPPTKAMKIGTLVHKMILEPEIALHDLVVRPMKDGKELDFRSAEGKAWRDEKLASGREIVTRKERDDILGICNSVMSNPDAKEIFAEGAAEVSLFGELESTPVKARIDWVPPGNILVDIKTTADASPRSFSKTIAMLQYHMRAAFYMDLANSLGMERHHFYYVTVENTAPYICQVYTLSEKAISAGRDKYKRLLNQYQECLASDEWPGYADSIQEICLPDWA